MVVRRGTVLVTGASVLVLAVLIMLLASRTAAGSGAKYCGRLSVQSEMRERMVTGHGSRVAVIGDSYSVGFGLRDPRSSWPSRLPGQVHVYGFSGSGFSAHSSRCPGAAYADRAPRALRSGADLVVVEGGLNDFDQPTADLRSGFRSLVRELRGRAVLVVGPPAAPVRATAARRVDEVLREECARVGVRYLSMAGQRFSYLGDRLHLTPAGHEAFGAVVARAVTG